MNLIGRALLAGLSVAVAAGTLLRPRPKVRMRRTTPEMFDDALVASDGTRLPMQVWQAAGDPVAVMVAVHGFADWRRSFEVSAPLFAARNVLVYAYDQRGFGETASRGAWPGVEPLLDDLADAAVAVGARHPKLPLVILGENIGASLALLAATRADPPLADALMLAAPAVQRDASRRELHDAALRLAALALPWLVVELQRGAHPWLLDDEAKRFAQDPNIVRELGVDAQEGIADIVRRTSEAGSARLPPSLVLHGALDTTVPDEAIRHLMARLAPRASLLSYSQRHHLLLHEEDVDRVVDDCVRWLEPLLPAARARRRRAAQAAASGAPPGESADATAAEAASGRQQVVKAAE